MTAPTAFDLPLNGAKAYQIEGTLQSVISVDDAGGDVQRLELTIVDDAGHAWRVDAGPSQSVAGWERAAKPIEGSPVSLMVRYKRGFQFELSTGFVLRDELGPIIAGDQAQGVATLSSADLPGFSVSLGEARCSRTDSCAEYEYHALVFSGSTSTTVELDADSQFSIDSRVYTARNLGAIAVKKTTCTDIEVASPWAMWRGEE